MTRGWRARARHGVVVGVGLLSPAVVIACGAEETGETQDAMSTGDGAGTSEGSDTGDASTSGAPTSESGDETTMGSSVAFADVAPLISLNCVTACHEAGGIGTSVSGLLLSSDRAYERLVNVASTQVPGMLLVAPGSPSDSYLWHKLAGTFTEVGGDGKQMPPKDLLDGADIELFERWISDGAKL